MLIKSTIIPSKELVLPYLKNYDFIDIYNTNMLDSNQWEFTYCDVHPKAELQVFKNKRWQKVKIVNGVSEGACEDVDQPYEYIQSSPIIGKYRVKHYGDKKFSTAYLNLKIERKNSI